MTFIEDTEHDMAKIREIFERAANAIVQATELSKQVRAMQIDVDNLRSEIEHVKSQNARLDEALANVRRQRDEAEGNLSQARHEVRQLQAELDIAKGKGEAAEQTIASLQSQVEQLRKERDDYGLEAMQANENLEKARATLKKLREAMGIPEPVEQPKLNPEPSVAQPEPIQAEPEPVKLPEPVYAYPEPQPEQVNPASGDDWAKSRNW